MTEKKSYTTAEGHCSRVGLSEATSEAIATFQREASGFASPDVRERATRTVETLGYFAPDSLSRRVYDVAALQLLADHLRQPNKPLRYHAAGMGFLEYFTYPDDDRNKRSNGYVGTLLGDHAHIDKAAIGYEARLADSHLTTLSDVTSPIPQSDWMWLRVGANIPEIAQVHHTTNMESQLARAALVVDRIAHSEDDDHQLFGDILGVESFYAPLLEVYGLHAFDMMAQSAVGKARAIKSGNEATLHHAIETLDRAKQISTDDIFKKYFGTQSTKYLFKTPDESLYGEPIVFNSVSLAELTDGKESGELNSRFKSVGKYAMKLLRNPRYTIETDSLPADVFGMLAVLSDSKQLGEFFSDTITRVIKDPSVEFTRSASKKRPVYIQGSPEFVSQVGSQLPNDIYTKYVQAETIKDRPADHIYQVAKFTSTLTHGGQVLPVEFQFQTQRDRTNARLGVPSHMNHNAGEGAASIIPGTPEDLRTIFMSRYKIDPNGEVVNTRSIPHGEEFSRQFRAAIGS